MPPLEEPQYTVDQWKQVGSNVLEAWKKTVDVQAQFNDIELRIRNYAITLLVAIVGAAAYAMKEHLELPVGRCQIPLAVPLLGAGLVSLLAFYFMDRFWYQRLLQGAVKHGMAIGERWRNVFPDIGLGNRIKEESPIKLLNMHSERKIDVFYLLIAAMLVVMIVAFLFSSHH